MSWEKHDWGLKGGTSWRTLNKWEKYSVIITYKGDRKVGEPGVEGKDDGNDGVYFSWFREQQLFSYNLCLQFDTLLLKFPMYVTLTLFLHLLSHCQISSFIFSRNASTKDGQLNGRMNELLSLSTSGILSSRWSQAHIYMESRKMVPMNLFTGQQWRCRYS